MNNQFFNFFDLHNGEENHGTVLDNVTANTSFRGSNLWILACAILIASVGLNVNSTAVIIGAMLISPLMGPIVGAGFALGTYNFTLLKKSFKNLLNATLVSLAVSCVYFYVSPFKDAQSELLARTSPNIYDVLIAFFGGLVGVIAITRVEKGNPIPGVAIATALMPPLCTAGYGLATGNITYFFGAFYLYTINCFFICIATFFVVKYLKYRPVERVDKKADKRIRYGITALILVMIIPSFYLAYSLLQEKKFKQSAEKFITKTFTDKGYTVIYKKINYRSKPKTIELGFLSGKLSADEIKKLNLDLRNDGLTNTNLLIKQDATDLKAEILSEIGRQNNNLSEKDLIINKLKQELATYNIEEKDVLPEIKALFPEVTNVRMGNIISKEKDSTITNTIVLYQADTKKLDTQKLKNWLKVKLKSQSVIMVQE